MVTKKKKRAKPKRKSIKRRLIKKRTIKKKTIRKKITKERAVTKKKVKKAPAAAIKKIEGKVIGVVTHYFPKVRAGVVKLKTNLAIGDTVKIKGHTTDFTQAVTSMQIDHVPINQAKKRDEIGLLVNSRVRQHDIVYKV